MDNWILFLFAVLLLIMVPLAPKLLRLRIRFFRWIHWEWAAKVIEDHFQVWCLFLRVVFLVISVVLLYFGWTQ